MPSHFDGQLALDVPRDWEELTVVRYEAPRRRSAEPALPPARAELSLVKMRDDEELGAHAERRLAEVAMASEGFLLRTLAPTELEGRAAFTAEVASLVDGVPVEHQVLFVQLRERRAAMLTLRAARSDLPQLAPLFRRMLASVHVAR